MGKLRKIITSSFLMIAGLSGCNKNGISVSEIAPYFFETSTYKELDYQFANNYFAEQNDNWGGGCSAISAVVDGTRLVGRNMDLNISNKCAYVVRTDIPKKYETYGLAYTFRDISPDYEEVKKTGLSETFTKVLPFMCDDVMNSEGLHIEINMRHGEKDSNGNDVFGVEHTNKDAQERIYVFALGQYIALNCKNLNDVKNYLKNDVDVYSKKNYWNYCFIVTDSEGKSALLEFGLGEYFWTEPDENGVVCQTNFYVNQECNEKEDIKTGLGRYNTLMNEIGDVTCKKDLYNLMKKVQYSSYYLPYDECKANHFDPRSEIIGEKENLTYSYIMAPEMEQTIKAYFTATGEEVRSMTRQQQQDKNEYWESTFTEIVNTKEKTIEVRLFENEEYLYKITFNGTSKISTFE